MEVCIFKNGFQVAQECKSKQLNSENLYKQVYQFLINFLRWANLNWKQFPVSPSVRLLHGQIHKDILHSPYVLTLIPLIHHAQHSSFP